MLCLFQTSDEFPEQGEFSQQFVVPKLTIAKPSSSEVYVSKVRVAFDKGFPKAGEAENTLLEITEDDEERLIKIGNFEPPETTTLNNDKVHFKTCHHLRPCQ